VARVVIEVGCVIAAIYASGPGATGKPPEVLVKGMVLEVTAAQAAAITAAGGTTRAVSVTAATSVRDQMGESFAASNATP
jgi:hypothetical protein